MHRRSFLQTLTATPALAAADRPIPRYRVVTPAAAAGRPGMPGPYPGVAVRVDAANSIDPQSEQVDKGVVVEMMARGMRELTGDRTTEGAWRRFFSRGDVVGIKVNCSGAPNICSSPEIVGEVARNLVAVGVRPQDITLYERFRNQVETVHYERWVPEGVQIFTPPGSRMSLDGYDQETYVDVDFFGEDETRSHMIRLVRERFTKIVNIPNLKDHGASGVTGCLKNIAYGSFHNVARSHRAGATHTYSFIATLAMVEPLRSRTVLQILDGLKAVWHGGPFSPIKRFRFFPGLMMFGTDPVAIDRQVLEIVEAERKRQGVISVWDRSERSLSAAGSFRDNPNRNNYVREPGHIEYASSLGLGVYDAARIRLRRFTL